MVAGSSVLSYAHALEAVDVSASKGNLLALLRVIRTDQAHVPDVTLTHGAALLCLSSLPSGERLAVAEQVAQAALALGRLDWASHALDILTRDFPDSRRVRAVEAACIELAERKDVKLSETAAGSALRALQELQDEFPENTQLRRRRTAAEGGTNSPTAPAKAVAKLNDLLAEFGGDTAAWQELAAVLMDQLALGKAAFCWGELLLHQSRSLAHLCTFAEMAESQGDVALARKYFSYTLFLDDAHARALVGLVRTVGGKDEASLQSLKKQSLQRLTMQLCGKRGAGARATATWVDAMKDEVGVEW